MGGLMTTCSWMRSQGCVPMASRAAAGGAATRAKMVTARVSPRRRHGVPVCIAALDARRPTFPSFVGVESSPRPGSSSWTAVLTFASHADLQRWQESPERADLLHQGPCGRRRPGLGCSGRLPPLGIGRDPILRPPPETGDDGHRRALCIGVSPQHHAPELHRRQAQRGEQQGRHRAQPLPAGRCLRLATPSARSLLTWVLMPVVTRLLRWWLNGGVEGQTVRSVIPSAGDLCDRGSLLRLGV